MKKLENITWKGSRERPIVLDAHWSDEFDKHSIIIFGHGYKGFKDWGAWNQAAEEFSKAGFLFIKFNFSFNGGTAKEPIDFPDLEAFGNNNYSTEIADFKRVIDFVYLSNTLPREKLNLDDLTIMGHSRGGGMAILTTHQDSRVKRLITLASISDLERRQKSGQELEDWKTSGVRYIKNGRTHQEMPHFYQFYEDYIENKANLDILSAAAEVKIPWLIVHGADDTVVPFSEAQQLKDASPNSELANISETSHVFGAKHPWEEEELPVKFKEVMKVVLQFLEK